MKNAEHARNKIVNKIAALTTPTMAENKQKIVRSMPFGLRSFTNIMWSYLLSKILPMIIDLVIQVLAKNFGEAYRAFYDIFAPRLATYFSDPVMEVAKDIYAICVDDFALDITVHSTHKKYSSWARKN